MSKGEAAGFDPGTPKGDHAVITTIRRHKNGLSTMRFYYKNSTPRWKWKKLLAGLTEPIPPFEPASQEPERG